MYRAHDDVGAAVAVSDGLVNQPTFLGVQATLLHMPSQVGSRLLALGRECMGERFVLSTVHSSMMSAQRADRHSPRPAAGVGTRLESP